MTEEKLPRISEAQIRKLASSQSFERGEHYYENHMVSETVRQGMQLRGECEGSSYEPYEINVTLDAKGIASTSCTCPYDWDGICKHIVALLLAYVHQPESFRVITPLEEMLKDRSREELIALIGEMSRQDSKLMPLIEVSSAHQHAKAGKAVDIASLRKRVRRAMKYDDWEYGDDRRIQKELRSLGEIASHLLKADDWLNAGALYHALLDEAIKSYDEMMQQIDENGRIAVVVNEFAEALGECLTRSGADSKTRRDWLSVFLDGYLKDIEIGGIDFASGSKEILAKQTDEEEWAWIEGRVKDRINDSREWEREQLVKFLADGLKHHHKGSNATELIREMGTPEQQAELLAGEGRVEEATRMMSEIVRDKPGLVTLFADKLLEAKAREAALRFVLAHSSGGWRSDEWLADYYRKYGTPEEAVEGQKRLFLNSPSVKAFENLQKVCRKTKNWPNIRAEVLATLEREKKFSALIEVALHEEDVARALELLPHLMGWGGLDLKMRVAKAAEKDLPREAIKLYRERAEKEIEGRSRSSYHTAAGFLKNVKRLYIKLGDEAVWVDYIKGLRETHKRLPALQDELSRAGL
jgi:uncharacterized Zn finger protein